MKQIKFIPDNDEVKKIFGLPKPAKQCIPEWYKKPKNFIKKLIKSMVYIFQMQGVQTQL